MGALLLALKALGWLLAVLVILLLLLLLVVLPDLLQFFLRPDIIRSGNPFEISRVTVFTVRMIQAMCHRGAHQRIWSIFRLSATPHIVNQDFTHKRQTFRTWIPTLIHNDG